MEKKSGLFNPDGSIKEHTPKELRELYEAGEGKDKAIFQEMRSNVRLISGEHYNKARLATWRNVRVKNDVPQYQRLRLTKNHITRVCGTYTENLLSMTPDVQFGPDKESELRDRKQAEMNQAIWDTGKRAINFEDLREEWGSDAMELGEVHTGLFYDDSIGKTIGFEPLLDEMGQEVVDPQTGEPVPDESKPIKEGAVVAEEIHGFNLIRDPNAKDFSRSPWVCHRKMVDVAELKELFPEFAEKIDQGKDETLVVFDADKADFRHAGAQVMVKEFYFRPCMRYPNGYYYIMVNETVLDKGELPGGIFPIISRVMWKVKTSARGRSMVVKVARPYQAEINRTGSKIAEHQITLGDDKILTQNGANVQHGISLPGIRHYTYTGAEPKVFQGRSGAHFLDYMMSQIDEMYEAVDLADMRKDKESADLDPMVLLFRHSSKKKRMGKLIRRFEGFLKDVAETYIRLVKHHAPDETFLKLAGQNEIVNIAEFRRDEDLNYQIRTEARSDDVESAYGQQLILDRILQYSGGNLTEEQLGLLIKDMPLISAKGLYTDLTREHRLADNIILALERGEVPPIGPFDNNEFIARKISDRMREPDFGALDPPIQEAYAYTLQAHEMAAAEKLARIKQLEQQFIPIGGPMVKVDYYVNQGEGKKPSRALVPLASIIWLINALETQGTGLEQIQQLNPQLQGDIGEIIETAGTLLPAQQPGA